MDVSEVPAFYFPEETMRSSVAREARIDLVFPLSLSLSLFPCLSSGRRTRPSFFSRLFYFAGPLRAGHPATAASGLLPGDVSFSKHSHEAFHGGRTNFFAIKMPRAGEFTPIDDRLVTCNSARGVAILDFSDHFTRVLPSQ